MVKLWIGCDFAVWVLSKFSGRFLFTWCKAAGVQFEEDKKEQNLLRTVLLGYNSLNCLGSELFLYYEDDLCATFDLFVERFIYLISFG